MSFDKLKAKRSAQQGLLTKTSNFVDAFDEFTGSVNALKAVRSKLEQNYKTHELCVEELMETAVPAEAGRIEADADKFRDSHIMVCAALEDKIDRMEGTFKFSSEREDDRRLMEGLMMQLQDMKSQLASHTQFVENSVAADITLGNISRRRDSVNSLINFHTDVFKKACCLADSDERQTMLEQNESFRAAFDRVADWYEEAIEEKSPKNATGRSTEEQTGSSSFKPRIQLPSFDLPKFDGTPELWINFRDTYKSLIHDNNQLSGSTKFRYLKSSITDKFSPIAHLLENDDEYDDAWALTLLKYDDERKMMERHFQAILATKKMQLEDSEELQHLTNEVKIHVAALERLLKPEQLFPAFVAFLVSRRLDAHTRDVIETNNDTKIPFWNDLCKKLEKRSKVLNTMPKPRPQAGKSASSSTRSPAGASNVTYKQSEKSNALVASQSNSSSVPKRTFQCYMCSEDHRLSKCKQFHALTVPQRVVKCNEWKICQNCFGPHGGEQCRSTMTCFTCKQKHHTLLHPTQAQTSQALLLKRLEIAASQEGPHVLSPEAQTFKAHATCNTSNSTREAITMLSTAIVKIQDAYGRWHEARALLDSGSNANFVTKSVAQALQVKQQRTNIEASGLGQQSMTITHTMTTTIASRDEMYQQPLKFLVTSTITGLTPSDPVNRKGITIPTGIILADPSFHVPGKIDILIGNELFMELLMTNRIKLKEGPVLQESVLGWIIAGSLPHEQTVVTKRCHLSTLTDLRTTMEKFYNDEDYRNAKGFLTEEEKFCEEVFEQTHTRAKDGRFTVKLPLKSNIDQLTNNYGQAVHQFLANEKRLQKNEPLKTEYVKFLREYEELGHMQEIKPSRDDNAPSYYLPHHAVEKPESTTTSVRIVFNASSKTKSGLSFNDTQCVGPQIQSNAFTLGLKFRQHQIVIKADIAKMYRQIEVTPEHRKFQRIIWREDPSHTMKTFELKTVTYGTASASFQSTRCLKQLAMESRETFPQASEEIEKGFYIDDLISGASSESDAIKLFKEIDQVISSGAMKLRKLSSNSEKFISSVPEGDRERSGEDMTIKALGIKWNPISDKILIDIHKIDDTKVTKRTFLSEIAKIYDPEGLLGPVVFRFKIFMKKIWQLNVAWDEPLPDNISEEWNEITRNITALRMIQITRHVIIKDFIKVEMHGFSDASDQGYGAAVYIRSEDKNGNRACHLICAKSRIAPTERRSTARLELCGGVILANLMQQVEKAFIFKIDKKVSWMDSAIALHWLKKSPTQLQPFVANRVSEIQELSKDVTWRHVRGEQNPADMISRGLLPEEIVENRMWWHGPEFLMSHESQWPQTIVTVEPEDPVFRAEFKKIQSFVIAKPMEEQEANQFIKMIEDSSRLHILKRKLAIVMRFIHNARANKMKIKKRTGALHPQDVHEAEAASARLYQSRLFPDEFEKLSSGRAIERNSRIKNLDPFWDNVDKLIRVGGRLKNARHIDMNQKHPILLPRCFLTTLIVREAHQKNLHAGQQATLGFVMMKFWPLGAKSAIRKELHKCVKCFRARPKMIQQFMGQLPEPRITPAPAFYSTGIDYAGPFHIKVGHARSLKTVKVYVALFVCLATKAIHLEIVSDLTTQAFLAALSRFTSRRGISKHIHSDHGTNFVGASNELKEINEFLRKEATQKAIHDHLLKHEINWHFIPPRAPEHGGLWEAGVKSMKHHLTRVLQSSHLTFEEFYTITCSVEAILNSRPLMPISSDPNDPEALTAGHILIGRPLTSFPRHDLQDAPMNRLTRWDRIVQFQQQFWTRWTRDYLHRLQVRTKNYKEQISIRVGQMVLLDIDNCPPLDWPIGRIVSIQPGKDKVTRVATIKTAKGLYDRPVSKLALLPIDDNDQLFVAQDVNEN